MRAVIAVADLLARSRLEQAAASAGYEVALSRGVPAAGEPAPDVLLVDLDQPGTLDALAGWRAAHADARVVGFAFHVNEDVMARGRALGIEVLPHGATARAARIFS